MLSLYIPVIQDNITETNVKQVFIKKNYGEVERVDFVRNKLKNRREAFVHFKVWYDNEDVKEFKDRINNPNTKTRVYHTNNKFWPILINHNVNPEKKNPNYINENDMEVVDSDKESYKELVDKLNKTIADYNLLKNEYFKIIQEENKRSKN